MWTDLVAELRQRSHGGGRSSTGGRVLRPLAPLALGPLLFAATAVAQPAAVPAITPVAVETAAAPTPPQLADARLPAAGRQFTELRIGEAGRYSVRVESRQGVALQIVDRMSGAGEIAGEAGRQDGRLDLFLDRGAVRVVTFGPKLGRGEARLSVTPFRELHAPAAPRLPELRPVNDELGDLEQASWWIEVPERRRVVLEAAGRHLADLRLWQAGGWLVDAEPERSTIEPVAGRPLQLCRLAADLPPGLYRLVAYGGPEIPWARGGREKPLHLRFGIPARGEAGRERMSVGPFGFERFLLPGSATFVQLELPEAAAATLELAEFDPERPFEAWSAAGEIGAESLPPLASLARETTEGRAIVTVRAAAGQVFTLQHFRAERTVELSGDGDYWIGTVHAGSAGDSVDASAVLFERGQKRTTPIAAARLELDGRRGWARRFNLLDEATLFLEVTERGEYVLDLRGAAQVRLEPLLLSPPDGYRTPPLRSAPATWSLDPGLYVLTLVPVEGGIVDVALRRKGLLDPLLDWVGRGQEPPASPVVGAVQLPAVRLSRKLRYTLLVSTQPGVEVGPVVRRLPLDLTQPLPLSLQPGQEVEVPCSAATRGRLSAPAEDGTALELSLDGGAWATALDVQPGAHRVRVRSRADDTLAASLLLQPEERLADSPLPPLDPAATAALPAFATLGESVPAAFDLGRGEARTLLVEAPTPALYTLETTGLLATAGSVRTRVQPRLAGEEQNGTGRNVSLRAYLREGSYQFTVRALGASAGHLGARLRRADVREGGRLADGIAARTELPAGQAVVYHFRVEREGDYHLHALRLGAHLDVRLEDEQGFPPAAPVLAGDSRVRLLPGAYRLFVLPQAVPIRAVTTVSRVPEAVERQGHGPFDLALDRGDGNLWLEPAQAADPREPDRWRFELPAPTAVTIALDAEMEGELHRLDSPAADGGKPAVVAPGRDFTAELAAGRYELAVRCSRRNNQVRYTVRVSPVALVDGVARAVAAPALLPVVVGREGLVELASAGGLDVRARLYDADGRLLAAGDDRPGDWNFAITRRLAPGAYRLRVDPVGAAAAATTVTMHMPRERDGEAWTPPAPRTVELGDEALLLPLRLTGDPDLLAIVAVAAEPLGLELERRVGEVWQSVGAAEGTTPRLLLPLGPGATRDAAALRLRLRSLDRRPGSVRLSAFAGRAPRAGERALAAGLDLPRLPGLLPPIAAAAISLDRPGCLTLESGPEGLLHARRAGEPLAAPAGALVGDGPLLWLAAPADAVGSLRVVARRAAVGREPLALRLAPGEQVRCDLAPIVTPSFVEAQALAGEPLVAAPAEGEAPAFHRATVLGRNRAAALAPAGARSVVARNAGDGPLELRLTARPLTSSPPGSAPTPEAYGAQELRLAAGGARLFTLPPGAKSIRLALAAGGAAWLGDGGEREAFAWAADAAHEESLATVATALLVVNPTDAEVAARLELRAADPDDTAVPIAPGARLERRFRRAGGLRLPVLPTPSPGSHGVHLHVRGGEGTLLGTDGSVARGRELPLPAGGGTLLLDHPPGLVTIWADGPERTLPAFGFASVAPQTAVAPAILDLDGATRFVELPVATPSLLSLRAASPLAVALLDERGEVTRFEPFDREVAFDAPLLPGTARFAVRGLAGERLGGTLELSLAPLRTLDEGLGEAALLPPGGALGYRFAVERQGPVGVGARAETGAVETRVFDAAGALLGRGAVQWLELEPGSYSLVLTGPAGSGPLAARPALVGLVAPGDGPPREVVQQLLELERGGPPPETRGATGSEDIARPYGRDVAEESEEGRAVEERCEEAKARTSSEVRNERHDPACAREPTGRSRGAWRQRSNGTPPPLRRPDRRAPPARHRPAPRGAERARALGQARPTRRRRPQGPRSSSPTASCGGGIRSPSSSPPTSAPPAAARRIAPSGWSRSRRRSPAPSPGSTPGRCSSSPPSHGRRWRASRSGPGTRPSDWPRCSRRRSPRSPRRAPRDSHRSTRSRSPSPSRFPSRRSPAPSPSSSALCPASATAECGPSRATTSPSSVSSAGARPIRRPTCSRSASRSRWASG